MAVICPYCQNSLSFQKNLKPGKYSPACPKCSRKVQVVISDDPSKQPVVRAIQSEREKLETAPGPTGQSKVRVGIPPIGALRLENETAPATGVDRPTNQPATVAETVDFSANAEAVPTDGARDQNRSPVIDSNADTPVAPPPRVAQARSPASGTLPASLGGYQILKELGRGGMGAVYLARQLSLNRCVALKVMKPQWASNATFVARFTREAYAAAQLTHHNVVQIYDFGEDKDTTYFSMEFVDGETLSGLLHKKKRLDPEEASGYILQAARGLKFAHDQSMIHRDVKPDNLLLNRQGIVKVADLGLVKTPETPDAEHKGMGDEKAPLSAAEWPSVTGSSQITMAHSAMGTPSYMAPEQAKDAARVDSRADIYSLGCTLYAMVTGRPPFDGRTAVEILSKHQFEPMIPPEVVAKRVPKSLSHIVLKMTAKNPEDRYSDLGGVISDLETFLGISSAGPFTPREEHANLVEEAVGQFNASPAGRAKRFVLPGLVASCLTIAIICVLLGKFLGTGAFLGLGFTTVLADFVVGGLRRKTYLFQKAREFAFGCSITDWLFALAALGLFAGVIYSLGLFWIWLVVSVVGILLAFLLDALLDRRAEAERRDPIERVENLLRTLRLNGLNEESIRQFICKYSGQNWEECYETLFGYEAKLQARERWGRGDGARARPRFAIWRDPLISSIDAKLRAKRESREVATLQKVEERSLQSQGENLVTARRKAKRTAAAMVVTAGQIKESLRQGDAASASHRKIVRSIAEAASRPESILAKHGREDEVKPASKIFTAFLGSRIRFLAGAVLLMGCLAWMNQNGIISSRQLQSAASAVKSGDVGTIQSQIEAEVAKSRQKDAKTPKKQLQLPGVPSFFLNLVSNYGAGVSGLILIFSSFFAGSRMTLFAIPAAAIPILAPRGLPEIGGLDPSLAPSVIGIAIMSAGVVLGRSRS